MDTATLTILITYIIYRMIMDIMQDRKIDKIDDSRRYIWFETEKRLSEIEREVNEVDYEVFKIKNELRMNKGE